MPEQYYQSITEVVASLNRAFEEDFPHVCFQGEISEFTRAQSGHLYFTVKDEQAQLSAVMWRSRAAALRFKPAVGTAVLCHARPNIYSKNGRFQMIVNRMLPAGEGLLQQRFLELKQKLEKEGLFAEDRKRPIPYLPKGIGVVTSQSGAVIHDIMVKIRERFPSIPVYLVDARVQGPGAAEELAEALRICNGCQEIDVVILARGGGSLEDLWPFNEEVLVRAVFASRLPVVSGIGHEVDITLCDLAADLRTPTPTAAAETVVPRREELFKQIGDLEERLLDYDRWLSLHFQRLDEAVLNLERGMGQALGRCRLTIETAEAKLSVLRPHKVVSVYRREIEQFSRRLFAAACRVARDSRLQYQRYAVRATAAAPTRQYKTAYDRLQEYESRFYALLERQLQHKYEQLAYLDGRLSALSPAQVLGRGFSIVRREGAIVRNAQELSKKDCVDIEFSEGHVSAAVTEVME